MKLVYIGLRINGDEISQTFEDSKGKEHYWSGIKFLRMGHLYETSDPEGQKMKRTPLEIGEKEVSEEIKDQWIAKDMAALEFKRRKAASKKVSALKFSHKEVWELHSIYGKLNFTEKNRFLEAVQRLIIFGDKV